MKTPLKIVLLGALLALGLSAACDLGTTASQATSSTTMVATVLATPPIDVSAATLLDFDAGLPDAGVYDGGLVVGDAGLTIPPQTLVEVFLGQLQGGITTSTTTAPTGLPDASVQITEVGGGTWAVPETGGGSYSLLGQDAGFSYRSGATYQISATVGGKTYVGEVQQAPEVERIDAFHPATNYIPLDAGTDFTFTRPAPASGQERALAFVTVVPVDQQTGAQGQPTWTNVPTTPLAFLKLVVAPIEWRAASITIPGSAFPAADSAYVILMQSGKLGGAKSDNLFIGSPIIAGTAEVGVVKTRK